MRWSATELVEAEVTASDTTTNLPELLLKKIENPSGSQPRHCFFSAYALCLGAGNFPKSQQQSGRGGRGV